MTEIKDMGDDQFYPVGSFLLPQVAWLGIEDFFRDPLTLSRRINWINSEKLVWPE